MNEHGTVAERLAHWVSELRFEDLPVDVVERTKLLILDQVGVQVLGTTLPNVQPIRRAVVAGAPESTVTGGGLTDAARAAYVNGALGHSCEYDDAHAAAWHTSSAVVPAALALAELEGSSGRELITAVVAGVQVMGVLGAVTTGGMVAAGWHGSKVLGVFGAAAAAGRILGLSASELTEAFGIAGSDASGTMEYDRSGGEVKRLHAGSAARAGVEAAQLARLGLTGPATIFEGHRGVFRLFAQTESSAPDATSSRWQILDTIFRFYPMVGTVHAPLDAVRHLRETHALDAARIRRIRVGLVDFAVGHGASITRPADAISAQFSLAFGIGLQFVTGGNAPADYFDPARWNDPGILAIGDLVEPYPMPIPAGDPVFSARVDVDLEDGTTRGHYQAGFHGHPARPATAADIEAKFRLNVAAVLPASDAEAIMKTVTALDDLDDIGLLTMSLRR